MFSFQNVCKRTTLSSIDCCTIVPYFVVMGSRGRDTKFEDLHILYLSVESNQVGYNTKNPKPACRFYATGCLVYSSPDPPGVLIIFIIIIILLNVLSVQAVKSEKPTIDYILNTCVRPSINQSHFRGTTVGRIPRLAWCSAHLP